MRNLIVGFVAGVVAATLVMVAFSGVFRQSSEHRLIEDWRKIKPGIPADRKVALSLRDRERGRK